MEQEKVIERIKETAKRVLPENSSLYLYGSRARGEAREDSDWDLLILLDKPKREQEDFERYSYPFMEAGFDLNEYFSTHLYTKRQWDDMSFMPYYKNVEHDKIILL